MGIVRSRRQTRGALGRARARVLLTAGALVAAALALPATATAAPTSTAPAANGTPAAAAAAWAPASSAAVHPGVLTVTQGGGSCTANFVFRDGGGNVYLGQAAHCAGTGKATETNGCDSATMPVGTPVEIRGRDGFTATGTLAYSSWVTMQQRGEPDATTCAYNDFALVRLPADAAARTNPSLPFFGGPTGLATDGSAPGAVVYTYGNSPLRQGVSALSPKAGVNSGDIASGWSHEVYTVSPGVPGDSGSPFTDANGRALGLLSTLNLAPLPVSNGVADLAKVLAYANAHGGIGDVALVEGTEPFTTQPPGVSPQDLAPPAGPPAA